MLKRRQSEKLPEKHVLRRAKSKMKMNLTHLRKRQHVTVTRME
jgi:hypothetical protein